MHQNKEQLERVARAILQAGSEVRHYNNAFDAEAQAKMLAQAAIDAMDG